MSSQQSAPRFPPNGFSKPHSLFGGPARSGTPKIHTPVLGSKGDGHGGEADAVEEEDPKRALFKELFRRSEARLDLLFNGKRSVEERMRTGQTEDQGKEAPSQPEDIKRPAPSIKAARTIDEEDYGDDDEEEDEDVTGADSPLKHKSMTAQAQTPAPTPSKLCPRSASERTSATSAVSGKQKTSEEERKEVEEEEDAKKRAAEESSFKMFYTFESDRDAMIQQQRLDEVNRDAENAAGEQTQGTDDVDNVAKVAGPRIMGGADYGSNQLAFKNILARMTSRPHLMKTGVTDAQLNKLFSEVRKNRSKWASEDKIGQEELYEACDKVLTELKAKTEYSSPFLTKVNKREAPDYQNIIKKPMDLGTITKNLRQLAYKSKKEFVDDLNLIWANCLKYNADPQHFLRKKALYMRKETERLVPLIPDIVIKDRAEVEAEEQRNHVGSAGMGDDSDDDVEEPIMASRGRKAPTKTGKKGAGSSRKAPPAGPGGTPTGETKISRDSLHAPTSAPRGAQFGSELPVDSSQRGLSTPPPGNTTPHGHLAPSSGVVGSQTDLNEADSLSDAAQAVTEDPDQDDEVFKKWKEISQKERARIATERHRLFRRNRLNPDEPALLRTKTAMNRWMRQQRQVEQLAQPVAQRETESKLTGPSSGATIPDGIEEGEEDRILPDYYDPLVAIPEHPKRLEWIEDDQGQLVDQTDEYLRQVPSGYFLSPRSSLTMKMEANMRQMQETRKMTAKIGVVKQMQLQSQMYQNQFQKYEPAPFVEADVGLLVKSSPDPVMSWATSRATLQRSVGKIFYHAGFEDFQPSALEAVTDLAGDYLRKLVSTLDVFARQEKVALPKVVGQKRKYRPRYSLEETVLHTLHENNQDLESLQTYVTEDVERQGTRLSVMHQRMKSHLADLLRPALDTSNDPSGVTAFDDGSEQFVGGDFAADLDEDFFGFKELGLDREFGLSSLTVPLHLLQNRLTNYHQQTANPANAANAETQFSSLPHLKPVDEEAIEGMIGIVRGWFRGRLERQGGGVLIEDEELPVKQRFPKPRLPPNGKITSPRKRPLREQQKEARAAKRRRLNGEAEEKKDYGGTGGENNYESITLNGGGHLTNGIVNGKAKHDLVKPAGKLKLDMPRTKNGASEQERNKSHDKADGGREKKMDGSMIMSPESITAAA